jgi:hypothetical protein
MTGNIRHHEIKTTNHDIKTLVAFLPRLYTPGFNPIKRWNGGIKNQEGFITMAWPEYDEVVVKFFGLAAKQCWFDYDYIPEEACKMLEDEELISNASLSQIRTMLTYCVRGERFCEGFWGEMIEQGKIRCLLERLQKILESNI